MKRALVGVTLLGAMVALPAPGAFGATGAQVTVVQAATYDAGTADFPLTVCIDDNLIQADVVAGTVLAPLTLDAGDHHIDFVDGNDCEDEIWAHGDFTVIDGDDITAMSWWSAEGTQGVSTFNNDEECIPDGKARISVGNAAAVWSESEVDAPVSFLVTPQGGTEQTVFNSLVVGDANSGEVPAGMYSGGRFTITEDGSTIVSLPAEELTNGEHQTIYLFGGIDGDIGYFTGPHETLPTCDVPSTTTTTELPTTTTTTTPAPVTRAATISPRFTG